MENLSRRLTLLRRMARVCALLMLVIIGLSAYLRLANAGLGCEDWPQCYGAVLRAPPAQAAPAPEPSAAIVVVRSTHRVAATSVLLLVLALVALSVAPRPILWRETRIALAALVLVLFLAVLGRWSRGTQLPAVAVGNLLGGFVTLALCWRASCAGPAGSAAPLPARSSALRLWSCLAIAVLVLQIALGGFVSAAFAGLSCPGLIECASASGWSWQAFDPFRQAQLPNPNGAIVQSVHRASAVAVAFVLAPLAIVAIRRGARRAGAVVLALLAVQIGLGVALAMAELPLPVALAHNLVAAVLLTALVSLMATANRSA